MRAYTVTFHNMGYSMWQANFDRDVGYVGYVGSGFVQRWQCSCLLQYLECPSNLLAVDVVNFLKKMKYRRRLLLYHLGSS